METSSRAFAFHDDASGQRLCAEPFLDFFPDSGFAKLLSDFAELLRHQPLIPTDGHSCQSGHGRAGPGADV